jgi:hypothetical protein
MQLLFSGKVLLPSLFRNSGHCDPSEGNSKDRFTSLTIIGMMKIMCNMLQMEYITFRSMNPMYGREKVFQINLELQCKISFKMKMQTITYQMTILYCVFFKYFNNLNNLIFNVFENKNNFLKEKHFVHFSKRTHTMTARVQKIKKSNEQAMTNPINSFNENKNKEQTNVVFSNVKENDLSNQ